MDIIIIVLSLIFYNYLSLKLYLSTASLYLFVTILHLAITLSEFMILVSYFLNPMSVAIVITAFFCVNSSLLINQ